MVIIIEISVAADNLINLVKLKSKSVFKNARKSFGYVCLKLLMLTSFGESLNHFVLKQSNKSPSLSMRRINS